MTRFHDRNSENVYKIIVEADCALFMNPLV